MQHGLGAVDVLDEALDAAGEGEILLLYVALVDQLDLDAVVEEGQLAQALGNDVIVILDVAEDLVVCHEMYFSASFLGIAENLQRRYLDTVLYFKQAIDGVPAIEFHQVLLPIAPDQQPQPFGQGIDAGDADAMQTTGDFVRILVELAAGMEYAHDDLGGRAPGLVLVVEFYAGGYAATVIGDRNRIVGMDGDDDVVAVTGQCFINCIIDNFEHHVMQTGAIGCVTNVHPGALSYGLQAFELLDA